MTRSTRSVVRSGSRAGVGAQMKLPRFSRPNAKRANQRAISTSNPAFSPFTLMYPNGGASHLTPTIHRLRALILAGSAGSFAFVAAGAAGVAALVGDARPQAANAVARNAAATAAPISLLIQLLLLGW